MSFTTLRSPEIAFSAPQSIEIPQEQLHFAHYPGAESPARHYFINSDGLKIAVYEWGDLNATPLLLVHGGLDFGRTYDVYAPLIAAAGFRVIAYDHRGHGNSEYPLLYSWSADVRDLMNVVNSITQAPLLVMGHSKGGALLIHAIQANPSRFIKAIIIDGMPFQIRPPRIKDTPPNDKSAEIQQWLNKRHRGNSQLRKPGTIEELARRRGQVNPFLSHEWLCYLVTQGAFYLSDGWRWKIDPALNMGEFGPFRPRQFADDIRSFPIPFLAIFSTKREIMGWRATADDLIPFFPPHAKAHVMEDVGHFIHIERPQETAQLALDFLLS